MPTIYVSRNGNSTNLNLRDNEGNAGMNELTTGVTAGSLVIWQLDPNPPAGSNSISAITGIQRTVKDNNPNDVAILDSDPQWHSDLSYPGGGYWEATVKSPSPGRGKYETYNISFTVPGDTTVYTDDPKLQMDA